MKKTKICQHCDGTGRVYDDKAVGQEMRKLRESKDVTGREMARRLNFSAAYLSDLELGRRAWRTTLIESYKARLKG